MQKKIALLILLITIFVHAEGNKNFERMFYSCKIWGYYKYFHTEVAKGPTAVNWDAALLAHLAQIIPEITNEQYNLSLTEMLNKAGTMAESTTQIPVLPDSLKPNLDLNWLNDPFLSPDLKTRLSEIKNKFRPQPNYYVTKDSYSSCPVFSSDNAYTGNIAFPNRSKSLLSLFRYWNAINYFFPHKKIMDQDWDSTLVEFIPAFADCPNRNEYSKTMLRLAAHLNDSHGFVYGSNISAITGYYMLPLVFKTIENKTVVTNTLQTETGIEIGDIVLEVNNRSIEILRDSLSQYCEASNNSSLNNAINRLLAGGSYHEVVKLKIENKGTSKLCVEKI